ncbi:hypothetical protein N825_19500 [Skermanella stibiiresistens SB22]|uniref:Uncharacterized protein n=1 Tax=Skermanella stibiiresistens SB22 TaxID=1385369 RepID=W9HBH9_9PROT|nr:hypothetical protein [Skermanella stibiiresistens]EWY42096.1 hypothetical protein N825_19500 [Skermanella stibiiresistens SB22]
MSDAYTNAKIREALLASKGSRARAQDILMGWAQTDDDLLRGLVSPYLKGIVAGTVERVTRPSEQVTAPAPVRPSPPARPSPPVAPSSARAPNRQGPQRQLSPEALDKALAMMGQGAPPRQAAPTPVRSPGGLKLGTTNPVPPTKAGAKHQQTMRALAALYARKHEN